MTPDASGPVPIAWVAGEVDLATAPHVREEVLALAVNDVDGVIVDLSEVPYLDSAGVKVLFQLARDLRQRDQSLLVTVPVGSPLRRVLKITGLHEVAPICEEIASALELIGPQPESGA